MCHCNNVPLAAVKFGVTEMLTYDCIYPQNDYWPSRKTRLYLRQLNAIEPFISISTILCELCLAWHTFMKVV